MSHESGQPRDLFQLAAVTPAELAAIVTAAAGSSIGAAVLHQPPGHLGRTACAAFGRGLAPPRNAGGTRAGC